MKDITDEQLFCTILQLLLMQAKKLDMTAGQVARFIVLLAKERMDP